MNTAWLAQLAPAHAPSAPGWWPPAPGWWLSATLALIAAAVLVHWGRDPLRRARRCALRELARLQSVEAPHPAESARAIENLLRRYAIAVFGAPATARLAGRAWLVFIGTHGGTRLAGQTGRSLLAAAFGGHARESEVGGPLDETRAIELWLGAAAEFVRAAVPAARRQRQQRQRRREARVRNRLSQRFRPALGRVRKRGLPR